MPRRFLEDRAINPTNAERQAVVLQSDLLGLWTSLSVGFGFGVGDWFSILVVHYNQLGGFKKKVQIP